jgi:hypothetical protein
MNESTRISGSLYKPDGTAKHIMEVVKDKKSLGRWIYCKFCYKSVKPRLSGVNQVVCSQCGAGLSPDFFKFDNLVEWLKTGDNKLIEIDHESREAKEWLESKRKV